ncbi:MAG: hypothetical protein Q9199_006122 [Rusavskia elegans]
MPMLSPRESETYPNMRKCRVERCEAIAPGCFCDYCYNGHEDPHEAVLEHAKSADLANLTLNHVNPLRGILQRLPQHLASQLSGHTHGLGLILLK